MDANADEEDDEQVVRVPEQLKVLSADTRHGSRVDENHANNDNVARSARKSGPELK